MLIGRILLLTATIFLIYYLLSRTQFIAATLIVILLLVYQMVRLIHFVEKTNRDLTRFLLAIKYSDFSQTFVSDGLGRSFDDLNAAFNAVILKFQDARAEKEQHYRYLQTVIQHIGMGLIAFANDGSVSLINNAAKKLLSISYLRNIASLKSIDEDLVHILTQLGSGQRRLVAVEIDGSEEQLMLYATEFRMRDRQFTLVSLQNISPELEAKELESWQKLIRVLTHEIMNSITPISSLATTANTLLEDAVNESSVSREAVEDVHVALQTIGSRSKGLLTFVDAYRNLSRIPTPNFQIFSIEALFQQILTLMRKQLESNNITVISKVSPESLELTADPELVEQILINLVLNAIQALRERPAATLRLNAFMDSGGRVVLEVIDNGPGMMKEVQEKIFIPFFTTRKEGSGIGLSLARQIMRLHRGSISVRSKPEVETKFTLRF